MNPRPLPPHLSDDELVFFLEAEDLLPPRPPLEERYPQLFQKAQPIDVWAEADVCGWPDDETPLEDAKKHRQWCDALKRRMAIRPENPADRKGAAFNPARSVPPPGRYQIEIIPRDIRRIERGAAKGFAFWARILFGDWDDCELCLTFWTEDPSGKLATTVRHDLQIMAAWLHGLGIVSTADELDFVNKIIRKGQQRDVFATLGHKRWRRGLDIYIADIEVRP